MIRRHWLMSTLAALGTTLCLSAATAQAPPISAKQLGAPPADVLSGRLRLPDPTTTAVHGGTTLIPITLASDGQWSRTVTVAHRAPWSFAVAASPDAVLEIEVRDPSGVAHQVDASIDDDRFAVTRGDIGAAVPGTAALRVDVDGGPGDWTITVRSRGDALAPDATAIDAAIVIADRAPVVLTTHLESFELHAGRPITLSAALAGATASRVELRLDDHSASIPMQRVDGETWIGAFVAPAGPLTVTVAAFADQDDIPIRTTAHRLTVINQTLELTGVGVVERPNRDHADWTIWLDTRWHGAGERVMLGAELWGHDPRGNPTCIMWAGGYAEPDEHGALPLSIHDAWFDRQDVAPPYVLRNVRVQHASTFIPIDTEAVIQLDGLDRRGRATDSAERSAFTADMLAGRPEKRPVTRVVDAIPATLSNPTDQRALVLVHGYCSDGSPWRTEDFTGSVAVFRDPEANRSHDEFALNLHDATTDLQSFGVVGHSQGALAALHLSTFYFSGLDRAVGDRLIQSVGAPFQGTRLAGNAAVLGKIFGFGCGTAFDMTYDGAALWLANIPTAARANVHLWTTSFSNRRFRNDYCSFFTDLLLADPEDGVTETWAGQLPGAHDRGHAEGWCHTTGMQAPSQTHDVERNREMSERARR